MKIVTSVTVWNDAVGKRMSITYSEVENGMIASDNNREDRVITDADDVNDIDNIMNMAQSLIGE